MKRKLLLFSILIISIFLFLYLSPRLIVITSSSMKPIIAPGDLVLTINVHPSEIREGDVIVYRKAIPFSSIEVVAHRVIEVKMDNGYIIFKTKGDANPRPDQWDVTPKEVLGKAFLVIPKIGWLLHYIRVNLPSIILISLGIWLIFINIEKERSFIDH
ncbi:MAG: signal peptidase I [Methanocellales archaeon]